MGIRRSSATRESVLSRYEACRERLRSRSARVIVRAGCRGNPSNVPITRTFPQTRDVENAAHGDTDNTVSGCGTTTESIRARVAATALERRSYLGNATTETFQEI